MRRRTFLGLAFGAAAAACAGDPEPSTPEVDGGDADPPDGGAPPPRDAAPAAIDAPACTTFITLYDTLAVALYFDGSLGPTTGTIRVADMVAGAATTFDFWHGHGGQLHRFTVTATHYAQLRRGQRVMITTTTVDSHEHMLFVDPRDPQWRAPDATPVQVPSC
jgi:hypothetical protein